MDTLSIRRAHSEDAPAVQRLLAQLGYENTLLPVRRRIERLASLPHDELLVAVQGDRVVGLIGLHVWTLVHKPGRCGRITVLCVDHGHRREGIGTALVERLARVARRRRCVELEVMSGSHRKGAHLFYETLGFVPLQNRRFTKVLSAVDGTPASQLTRTAARAYS